MPPNRPAPRDARAPTRLTLLGCLRRWFNHLCPDVKKGSWTADEDRVIMESVREFGTRWSHIVKLMPGRTECPRPFFSSRPW